MARRFYPAVLEKSGKDMFGAWFPDLPDAVAAGRSQDEAIRKAEEAVALAIDVLTERDQPLPEPTRIEDIVLPKGCRFVAYFVVGVEPPDPSERVNIYLPKSLIARADKRAADLGMSRSSFFGLAISMSIGWTLGVATPGGSHPRSKAQTTGTIGSYPKSAGRRRPLREPEK
jgi:predicted RNase H-like HicB family nuclease